MTLRSLGIAACGTAKKGSGFPKELLAFRDVASKNKNWGLQAHMIVDKIMCMSWVDNNSVQLMSTNHSIDDFSREYFMDARRRNGIPPDSAKLRYLPSIAAHSTVLSGQVNTLCPFALPVPTPIHDYNLHMGGSDGNAQQRAYYTSNRRSDRYWWPLFSFLLDAAVLNTYKLHMLDNSKSDNRFSHAEFLRHIGTSLLQNPMGNTRYRKTQISVHTKALPLVPPPAHHWLDKKQRCHPCALTKTRPSKRKGEPLGEIDGNGNKRYKRGSQTVWACEGCHKPCCKNSSCWNALHVGIR